MIRFLIDRPISVIMTFVALAVLGVITYFTLPVSLLPDTDIPVMTVSVEAPGLSAREIENSITSNLRRRLMQAKGLLDFHGLSRDGNAVITLDFDYGTDMDLAFIDVNEKIDAASASLPKDINRPKVIRSNVTDIPVLYIFLTLKPEGRTDFTEFSEIATKSIIRRIEQLPEVSMVDVSGIPQICIAITVKPEYRNLDELSVPALTKLLSENNQLPGTLTVRNGQSEYSVNVMNQIDNIRQLRDLPVRVGDRLVRLGDVAVIEMSENSPNGYVMYNGQRAIALAVIKQNDKNIDKLRAAIDGCIDQLEERFPDVIFSKSQSQTELLDVTISNLVQNLVLGLILVLLITSLFMGDVRTSLVIGLTIMTALILTMLLFYIFKVTLNIISLSGLILAMGMMIDNSVIVCENIEQWRHAGLNTDDACVRGTNEMITPMLSSSLTTIVVFLPLVFMSGIAGVLFADQAFSISSGLAMSYVTGIFLLPVLFSLFFRKRKYVVNAKNQTIHGDGKAVTAIYRCYDKGVRFCLDHSLILLLAFFTLIPLGIWMYGLLDVDKMPETTHSELMADVQWNEDITPEENRRRVSYVVDAVSGNLEEWAAEIGRQDYLADDKDINTNEAELYFRVADSDKVLEVQNQIEHVISNKFPRASYTFRQPENAFEKVFSSRAADLEILLIPRSESINIDRYYAACDDIDSAADMRGNRTATVTRAIVDIDPVKSTYYRITPSDVPGVVKERLNNSTVSTLRMPSQQLPIVVLRRDSVLVEIIQTATVSSKPDEHGIVSDIPLRAVTEINTKTELNEIHSSKSGEYYSLEYRDVSEPALSAVNIKQAVDDNPEWDAVLSGAWFTNTAMIQRLGIILCVSVILMYFILCAQFGSFLQPLIVLTEIPADAAIALTALYLTGNTLNLMSAIGIIVTCGIVINDSILKLDTINNLRKEGVTLLEAIHIGGRRRLKAIIMTSLTTILAMLPMLFTNDLGSQLQRPLCIAMISSMIGGTLISIFIIPVLYRSIYSRYDKSNSKTR